MKLSRNSTGPVLTVLDQAISGASNALPLLIVASYGTSFEFGQIYLLYAAIPFALGLGRSIIGEAVLGGLWTEGQVTLATVCLIAITTASAAAVARFVFVGSDLLAITGVSAAALTVLHDQLRLRLLARGNVYRALAADSTWLIVAVCVQVVIIVAADGEPNPEALYGGYMAGLAVSVAAIVALSELRNSPLDLSDFSVPRSVTSIAGLNTAAAAVAYSQTLVIAAVATSSAVGEIQAAQLAVLPLALLATGVGPVVLPRLRPSRLPLDIRAWSRNILALAVASFIVMTPVSVVGGLWLLKADPPIVIFGALQAGTTIYSAFLYVSLRRLGVTFGYVGSRIAWISATVLLIPLASTVGSVVVISLAMLLVAAIELSVLLTVYHRQDLGHSIKGSVDQ